MENALLYADDLVLTAETPDALNKLLQALSRWCLDNGILHQYQECLLATFRNEWQKEINGIPKEPESGKDWEHVQLYEK